MHRAAHASCHVVQAVLEEVPAQVCGYFKTQNIPPPQ